MKTNYRLKILDIVAVLLGLAAVLIVTATVYSDNKGRLMVYVTGESGEWIQPLDKNGDIEVPGPLGSTWIHIEGNRVHISSSPCPNQTCVAAGDIESANQWLACMPNNVFVHIEGNDGSGGLPDAASY
ncbi:MAG TPA: NusG domain II-containing protein [Rectinemataceae bacterium]|nr:NusG domain II-containing protein [Rectinemataceae bacterium]